MPRPPRLTRARLTRDASKLTTLSRALHASGSRVEDTFWENEISTLLVKLFRSASDKALEDALEHLSQADLDAFEVLLEQAETNTESYAFKGVNKDWDVLLVTAPFTVWTRYQLPKGLINAQTVDALTNALKETLLAPGVELALVPQLVGLDEMPKSFLQTWQWLHALGQRAISHEGALPTPNETQESFGMLADARHWVFAVAMPKGAPIFRWQLSPAQSRESCLVQWQERCQPIMEGLLAGCQFQVLQPDAYYVSLREADKQIRPVAIRAAAAWLPDALNVPARDLRAYVIAVGESKAQEYRIGYGTSGQPDVVYGTVWPVFERTDAQSESEEVVLDTGDEVVAVLREAGITEIRRFPGLAAPEYCEDCTAPLFPNALGELVHAELPEEAFNAPVQFH
jgi:hypothetical protein